MLPPLLRRQAGNAITGPRVRDDKNILKVDSHIDVPQESINESMAETIVTAFLVHQNELPANYTKRSILFELEALAHTLRTTGQPLHKNSRLIELIHFINYERAKRPREGKPVTSIQFDIQPAIN